MSSPPELHRPVRLSRIASTGSEMVVEANEAERAALATRMELPAILSLTCRFRLKPEPHGVIAAGGELTASVVQNCVVTLEDFEAPVGESFTVRFVPAGTEKDDPDPDAVDEIPYEGDVIDLGEAAAEQLALSLDPYPRSPGAELPEAPEDAADARLADLLGWRRPGNGDAQ